MTSQPSKKEIQVEEKFQRILSPNEALLSFTSGRTGGKQYDMGLTSQRIIIAVKNRGILSSSIRTFWLAFIDDIAFHRSFIKIQFENDLIQFQIRSKVWKNRANAFVESAASLIAASPETFSLEDEQLTAQIEDFYQLGFINIANGIHQNSIVQQPMLTSDPRFLAWKERLSSRLFGLRAASAFLIVGVLLTMSLSLVTAIDAEINPFTILISNIVYIGINLFVSYNLWRGNIQNRSDNLALFLVIFSVFSAWTDFVGAGVSLLTVSQLSFAVSIFLALWKNESMTRTYIAIAIYTIGYILFYLIYIFTFIFG